MKQLLVEKSVWNIIFKISFLILHVLNTIPYTYTIKSFIDLVQYTNVHFLPRNGKSFQVD